MADVTLTFDLVTLKVIGLFAGGDRPAHQVWSSWAQAKTIFQLIVTVTFQFKVTVTLTLDVLTSKSIGVFYWALPTCIPSMKFLGQSVLQLLSGNHFLSHKVTMTLTFDLLLSKSTGVSYWSWPTCISSMKSVIERKQVWQTEGRTEQAKTICHPHVWGRHTNPRFHNVWSVRGCTRV